MMPQIQAVVPAKKLSLLFLITCVFSANKINADNLNNNLLFLIAIARFWSNPNAQQADVRSLKAQEILTHKDAWCY